MQGTNKAKQCIKSISIKPPFFKPHFISSKLRIASETYINVKRDRFSHDIAAKDFFHV